MSDLAHPLVAKLYDPVMALPERHLLPEHRQYLAAGLHGTVLELGCGTGAMFPYYEDVADEVQLTAIEPDPHMRKQAQARADAIDVDVEILDAKAESLPFADNSVDVVIASLVFCTIPDVDAAMSELARVLTPGGHLRFLEHVKGTGVVGSVHDVVAPCWYHMAGGCHLNRHTATRFQADDRFTLIEFERYESGATRLVPMVRGTLKRKSESLLARLS